MRLVSQLGHQERGAWDLQFDDQDRYLMVLGGNSQVHVWHLESGTIVRRFQEESAGYVAPFDAKSNVYPVCTGTICKFRRFHDNSPVEIGDSLGGWTRSARYFQTIEFGQDQVKVFARNGETIADEPVGIFPTLDSNAYSYLDLERRRGLVEGYFGRGKLVDLDTGNVLLDFDQSGDLLATEDAQRIVVRNAENELVVYDDLTPHARWSLGKKSDWGSSAFLKALSRDGRRALVLRGEVAQVVDLDTGRQVQVFRTGDSYPEAGSFSSDGSKLALAAKTGVYLFDITTGDALLHAPQVPFETVDTVLSPDGTRLLVTKVREERDLLEEWNLPRLELSTTRDVHASGSASTSKFQVLSRAEDGTTLLYSHYDGFVDLQPFPARLERKPRPEDRFHLQDYLHLPDGRHVFGAGTALVLFAPDRRETARVELPQAIKRLSYSAPHLAVTTITAAHLFELRGDEFVHLREEQGADALAIAERDGMVVYRSDYQGLHMARGGTAERCSGPNDKYQGRLFGRADSNVVLSALGTMLTQWDCGKKSLVRRYELEAQVEDITFAAQAPIAAVSTGGGPVSVIQLESGKRVDLHSDGRRWALTGRDQLFAGSISAGDVLGVARGLDGASLDRYALHYNRPDLLLSWWTPDADPSQIEQYRSAVRRRFERHHVRGDTLAPPRLAATARVTNSLAVIEFEASTAGRLLDLTVSTDGVVARRLAAKHPTAWKGQVEIPLLSGQNAVEIWVQSQAGIESEKVRFQLRPQTGADRSQRSIPSESPYLVRYAPDGKTVAILELLGRLLLVDTTTGEIVRQTKTHEVTRGLAFSPDGEHLFTSGYDGDGPQGEIHRYSARDLAKDQTVLRWSYTPEVLHVTNGHIYFGGANDRTASFVAYDRKARKVVRESKDRCYGDALLPWPGGRVVASCPYAEKPPIYGATEAADEQFPVDLGWGTLLTVDSDARYAMTSVDGLSVVDIHGRQRVGRFDLQTLGRTTAGFLPNERIVYSTQEQGTRIGTLQGRILGVVSEQGADEIVVSPSGDQLALRRFSSVDLIDPSTFTPIKKGKVLVVAWGVSDYEDDRLDLEFAARDATELGKWLSKVPGWNVEVKTFVDSKVTRGVVEELRKLASALAPEDTLMFFLAGHGKTLSRQSSEYYFLPSNVEVENEETLARTGIPFSDIEKAIYDSPARSKLLLLDTCESGDADSAETSKTVQAAITRGLVVRGLQVTQSALSPAPSKDSAKPHSHGVDRDRYVLTNLKQRSGAVVFSAAGPSEYALESRALRHGLFTASLLEIIKEPGDVDTDGNGQLDVREIESALRQRVSEKSGNAQNPRIDRENNATRFRFPVHWGRLEYR